MYNELLKYTGTVKITIGSETRRYLNSGTADLFRLFAQCLISPDDISPINLPQEVMLCGKSKVTAGNISSGTQLDALYYPIKSIVKQVVTTATGYATKFSLTILPTNLRTDIVDNLSEYKLLLKDGEHTVLASIDVEDLFIAQIRNGRQALIEWILEISN